MSVLVIDTIEPKNNAFNIIVYAEHIAFNATPAADTVSGFKATLTAHANVVLGDVCYINADGEAQIVDADAETTCRGLVMAAATISADAAGEFLHIGYAHCHTLAPAWTVGGIIYSSVTGTTTHTMTQTKPSGANDVIQVLGIAVAADIIFFNPQLVLVVHT